LGVNVENGYVYSYKSGYLNAETIESEVARLLTYVNSISNEGMF